MLCAAAMCCPCGGLQHGCPILSESCFRWHTSDVMGIGSSGPGEASADDLKGWSSTQVGSSSVGGRRGMLLAGAYCAHT